MRTRQLVLTLLTLTIFSIPSTLLHLRWTGDHITRNGENVQLTNEPQNAIVVPHHSPDFEPITRTWPYFRNHTWCHQNKGFEGLMFIKISKTGSSTNSGITIRIARKLGERLWNNTDSRIPRECSHNFKHGRHKQKLPRKRPGILWTFLRDPLSRGLSDFFHFRVSRRGEPSTADNLIPTMQRFKSFQLLYAAGFRKESIWEDVKWKRSAFEYIDEMVLKKYDFIGLVERRWESLALMKILWGLETSDLIVLSSKQKGGYDDGNFKGKCVQIQKPPRKFSPEIQDYLEHEFVRENHDYTLYDIANRSLDRTINFVGRELVDKEIRLLRATQAYADRECQATAIYPCSINGTKQVERSNTSCYYNDFGCGYPCTDRLLHNGYKVPDNFLENW